jgi:hypothetical protein
LLGADFGKTHLALRQMAYHARLPDQTIWAVYPTYRQAKMVAWKQLRNRLSDLRWVKKINETELTVELKNGSIIALKGADNYDSLRGVGLDYLILDEFADIDAEAWFETLRPTLADREGGALFIGTPKGLNWAHELYSMAEEFPEEWASFSYTTIEGGNVKTEEVEAARRSLDERTFRQEFEASFETFSGRVFYAFDRKHNVRLYSGDIPHELHIGIDFNLDPISAVIAVKQGNNLHVIDEIRMFGSNTDELCAEIKARYPNKSIVCYPDPAGKAGKTSAGGRTDHSILRSAGFRVLAPNGHNPVRDGINAVNAKLLSSTGITTLFIDPQCKYLIECLEKHVFKEGTSQPDKNSGFDHQTDALRYCVDWLYPIRGPVAPMPIKTWGHKTAVDPSYNTIRKF